MAAAQRWCRANLRCGLIKVADGVAIIDPGPANARAGWALFRSLNMSQRVRLSGKKALNPFNCGAASEQLEAA